MSLAGAGNHSRQRELTIEDLNFNPPQLPEERLREIALQFYGLEGEFRRLEGERDQNSRIVTADGRKYVLKISGAREPDSAVDFQVSALRHIAAADPGIPVPRVQTGRDGRLVHQVESAEGSHAVRVLSWLDGIPYQEGPMPSPGGLFGVGRFLARLNRALAGFAHPASTRFMPWDCTNGLVFHPGLFGQLRSDVQDLAGPFLERLQREVYPALERLRRQVIHQDGHGANLLRKSAANEEVCGMIDFGDMVFGPIVCDLAVSLTHFIEDASKPAAVAGAMCRGFHSLIPLGKAEIELVLDLVIARQVLILELFEFRRLNMEKPPRFVTEDQPGIIASLKMLLALDRKAFNRELRESL